MGGKIAQRISEFKAANNLTEISHLPPTKLHMLTGNRKDYFAVRVSENWRIVFRGLDKDGEVTVIKESAVSVYIKEVVDYHGD